jgi:hypothetical protein
LTGIKRAVEGHEPQKIPTGAGASLDARLQGGGLGMGRFLVCALVCMFLPAGAWATSMDEPLPAELLPAQLQPDQTTFAYRTRHGVNPLPVPALNAMWFGGEDRLLPRETVTEPIVVMPVQTVRHVPSRTALCGHAAAVAAEHDLPVPFFANLIQQESGFKSHAVSPAGAQGIAQFMPRVARAYGLENPFDPVHSLSVSAKFLRELLGQFGNLGLAAAAYNAGPKRVQDWMAKRGKLPEETRNYVRNITGHPAERWARVNVRMEETRLPPHARCPDIPAIEVSIPEAAPVKVAKNSAKGKSKGAAKVAKGSEKGGESAKIAAAKEEGPKTAAAKQEGPKLAAAKSYTLASISSAKQTAIIKDGKIKIMAAEKGAKTVAAKTGGKSATPAKAEAKAKPVKVAAKTAKPAAGKPVAKSKQINGKRVKLAAAR